MEPLKDLLIGKEDKHKKMEIIASKAKKLFRIEEGTGDIVFTDFEIYNLLSDTQKVGLCLAGRYIAKELGETDSDELGVTEISKILHRPRSVLTAGKGPVKTLLRNRGWIEEAPHRKYRVLYYRIEDILDDALRNIQKVKSKPSVETK